MSSRWKIYQLSLVNDIVIGEDSDSFREFCRKSAYGNKEREVKLSFLESLYLLEKGKVELKIGNKNIIFKQLFRKLTKKSFWKKNHFWVKYSVFKDLRERGYVVKTALKFGAEFRVYDRGIKPGEDHAKWIVYPVAESSVMTWYEFSAKNRVAHSTRKRLMLGVVDAEGDVTYWEVRWVRP